MKYYFYKLRYLVKSIYFPQTLFPHMGTLHYIKCFIKSYINKIIFIYVHRSDFFSCGAVKL